MKSRIARAIVALVLTLSCQPAIATPHEVELRVDGWLPVVVSAPSKKLAVLRTGKNVELTFDEATAARLEALTSEHVGRTLTITIEGVVAATPLVREPIHGGKVVVSLSSEREAEALEQHLK